MKLEDKVDAYSGLCGALRRLGLMGSFQHFMMVVEMRKKLKREAFNDR